MSKSEEFIKELNELERIETEEKKKAEDLRSDISSLKSKLSDLRDFRVKFDSDTQKDIKMLVSDVARLSNLIKTVEVPNEIKLIKENKVSFSDKTRVLMIGFFVFGLLFCFGSVWFANWKIDQVKNEAEIKRLEYIQNSITIEQQKWLEDFFHFQKKKNPKDTQKFIEENPIP